MQEFLNFIATVMNVDASQLTENTAYGEIEKWDSLMHLKLVMAIEENYDIEIPIDEVAHIKTLRDFYKYTQTSDNDD